MQKLDFCTYSPQMRGDIRRGARHAGSMILCAEYGLHFAKEGGHWRCVEHPDLLLLRGERYQVGAREYGSLIAALRCMADELEWLEAERAAESAGGDLDAPD